MRKLFVACLFAVLPFLGQSWAQSLPPVPPAKLAVNPITNKVYLANTADNTVTAFDAALGTSTTIAVDVSPEFIAVNPATNRVYVNNTRNATLSVIDGASDTLLNTYPIGSSGPIAIDPILDVIYIVRMTGLGSDEVTYFNGDTDTWYTIATNSFQPNAVAVNPATHTIYITHYGSGDVRAVSGVFNPADDFPATQSIPIFTHPFAIAANSVTNKVYAITQDTRGPIAIIDGSDNSVVFPAVASGHAQGPQAVVVNAVTNKVYAAFAGEVIVIDGATNALAYVPISGADSGGIALAVDATTNKIYAATSLGTLDVIDGDTDTVSATASIPAGTSSVGVNPLTDTRFFFDTSLVAMADATGDVTHPNPLTTTITPFAGDTSSSDGSLTLAASSGFAPNALAVRAVYFQIDSRGGGWTAASGSGPFTASFTGLAPGPHTIFAFAVDGQEAPLATAPGVGPLVGTLASYSFNVGTPPKADATISLASSANPSAAGQSIAFTASVAGSAGTPGGSVTFRDGTTTICANVPLAAAAAQCTSSALASGTHSITAAYSGDASYNPGTSAALSQVVDAPKAAASVALASSANPSTPGQSVTFTASVSGAAGTATGTVDFLDGASSIAGCAAIALSAGVAACTTSALSVTSHAITARFSGDAHYDPATSSALTQAVQAPGTFALTVTLSGSGTVASSPAGIDCGTTCSASFASGTTVTLTATATSGSSFTGWSGAGCSGAGTCSITMNAAASVTASFSATTSPVRLGNISTRGDVLTGEDVLIGGFIIGGSTPKTVVITAAGPSLAVFGIANPLQNPTMTLVRASDQSVIATNDDWQQAPNAADIQASGFAPHDPRESAILMTLAPGAYTAIVTGVGGTTGIGIVGVFEVDHPEVPLVNISTRGKVLTGDAVMIGGFIINGSSPQTVVINAAGPSLSRFGIASTLADPTLTLVRSSDQSVVATNDDWQSAPNAAQIQASGFAPNDPKEPAIMVTLPPGAYTAIVSGVGGGTGVSVVGVFAP